MKSSPNGFWLKFNRFISVLSMILIIAEEEELFRLFDAKFSDLTVLQLINPFNNDSNPSLDRIAPLRSKKINWFVLDKYFSIPDSPYPDNVFLFIPLAFPICKHVTVEFLLNALNKQSAPSFLNEVDLKSK